MQGKGARARDHARGLGRGNGWLNVVDALSEIRGNARWCSASVSEKNSAHIFKEITNMPHK